MKGSQGFVIFLIPIVFIIFQSTFFLPILSFEKLSFSIYCINTKSLTTHYSLLSYSRELYLFMLHPTLLPRCNPLSSLLSFLSLFFLFFLHSPSPFFHLLSSLLLFWIASFHSFACVTSTGQHSPPLPPRYLFPCSFSLFFSSFSVRYFSSSCSFSFLLLRLLLFLVLLFLTSGGHKGSSGGQFWYADTTAQPQLFGKSPPNLREI